jgi:membrane-associated phospholipid phosphatase
MFEHIIDFIGFHGPEILFITSIGYLYVKHNYVTIYTIGFVANNIINYILKGLFMQPRPTDNEQLFKMERMYRKVMTFERYGMPSGHAQSVLYSTIFIYFATQNIMLTLFYTLVSLATLYQRVASEHHFFSQTIAGAIIGGTIGFACYKYTRNHIQGSLKPKKDDYALG